MELRDRVIGPCGDYDESARVANLDLGELVVRLLLFDEVILESARLSEIPGLVQELGASKTRVLFAECPLRIRCSPATIGEAGQTVIQGIRSGKAPLPDMAYAFYHLTTPDFDEYLTGCLA